MMWTLLPRAPYIWQSLVRRQGASKKSFGEPSMANSCWLSRVQGGDAGSPTPKCAVTLIRCRPCTRLNKNARVHAASKPQPPQPHQPPQHKEQDDKNKNKMTATTTTTTQTKNHNNLRRYFDSSEPLSISTWCQSGVVP